ncbi:cyclase family protein [Salipiger marinus]|uniref:cyclase family protein n=1 Tax=Salipiger marinus TaxID=555512 RepID=UPI002C4A700C|nr:cyclase family protein [Salipiger manganoxidans]MEB3418565.1 cyclase family protein [Salipiger manganoxidans]
MRIHDLSMPILADHFRWPAPRQVTGDHSDTQPFQVTKLTLSCHSFTHVDARRHMLPGAPTIDQTAPEDVAGACFVADLSDVAPDEEITAARIAKAIAGYGGEPILLLRSAWDRQRDWRTPAYWREAPYMSREAARAVAALAPRAVAFDFPQDYTIRLSLDGIVPPITDHVTHDEILRHGITLIEYLIGTAALTGPRCFLCALPLKIEGADGAPARVVAFEGLAEAPGAT